MAELKYGTRTLKQTKRYEIYQIGGRVYKFNYLTYKVKEIKNQKKIKKLLSS